MTVRDAIMDLFKEKYDELMAMKEADQEQTIKELKKDCVCPICPTYNQCSKENKEKLFCILGKSPECIDTEKGCMCPTCPLAERLEIGIERNFFCIHGSELEQRNL
jgi:hypothetical protein